MERLDELKNKFLFADKSNATDIDGDIFYDIHDTA